MNAIRSPERVQAEELDRSDLQQPPQCGLLAELLRYQRRRVTELSQRRIHREQGRGFFGNSLTWLLARRS